MVPKVRRLRGCTFFTQKLEEPHFGGENAQLFLFLLSMKAPARGSPRKKGALHYRPEFPTSCCDAFSSALSPPGASSDVAFQSKPEESYKEADQQNKRKNTHFEGGREGRGGRKIPPQLFGVITQFPPSLPSWNRCSPAAEKAIARAEPKQQ